MAALTNPSVFCNVGLGEQGKLQKKFLMIKVVASAPSRVNKKNNIIETVWLQIKHYSLRFISYIQRY